MNTHNITEKDIDIIEQRVVEHLTSNLKDSGTEKLTKEIIKISARVVRHMILEYHKLVSG